jgi:hypothetical protein
MISRKVDVALRGGGVVSGVGSSDSVVWSEEITIVDGADPAGGSISGSWGVRSVIRGWFLMISKDRMVVGRFETDDTPRRILDKKLPG